MEHLGKVNQLDTYRATGGVTAVPWYSVASYCRNRRLFESNSIRKLTI